MEQKPAFDQYPETVTSLLEHLEVKVGKIGSNSPATALSILTDLDEITQRISEIDSEASFKLVQGPYESITGKLRAEAGLFLRDIGGAASLQKAREAANPAGERWWWFLDEMLMTKRKAATRRSLIFAGAFVISLAILGLVYRFFLAPDPQVLARYSHEQNARDALVRKDIPAARSEAEQGLSIAPNDPALLVLRGVALEAEGNQAAAEKDFEAARQGYPKLADFLVIRGQAYLLIGQTEKALADARAALQADPNSVQAYLLSGQAHEDRSQFKEALDDYNKAFEAADQNNQSELAAIARTKLAMLIQRMNMPQFTPAANPSITPGK